jgi:hypothetical protein
VPPALALWQRVAAGHRRPPVGLGPLPIPFGAWRDPKPGPPPPLPLTVTALKGVAVDRRHASFFSPVAGGRGQAPTLARQHPPCLCRYQGFGATPLGAPHAAAGWSFPHQATYPMSHRSPPCRPSSCRRQSSTALPVEPSPGRLAFVVSHQPSGNVVLCCNHPRVSRRSVPLLEPAYPSPHIDPNRSSSPSSSHLAGEAPSLPLFLSHGAAQRQALGMARL